MIGGEQLSGRARDHIDWPLFIAAALIAVLGVVNLYSATSPYFGTATATSENRLRGSARVTTSRDGSLISTR